MDTIAELAEVPVSRARDKVVEMNKTSCISIFNGFQVRGAGRVSLLARRGS